MLKLAAVAGSILILSGCAAWPRAGNSGLLWTDVTMPVTVFDPELNIVRVGEACSTGFLGVYAAGNSTVNSAKSKAGITKITMIEEHFTQVLFGAYSQYCTIVSGT